MNRSVGVQVFGEVLKLLFLSVLVWAALTVSFGVLQVLLWFFVAMSVLTIILAPLWDSE